MTQGQAVTVADDSLVELRESLAGEALAPGDDGYDAARICFNALVDRRPSVIARITGQQQYSGAAAARLLIEALGV
jgi:hypothetical protein